MYQKIRILQDTKERLSEKSLSCAVIVYISSCLSSANDMCWVFYDLRRAELVQ